MPPRRVPQALSCVVCLLLPAFTPSSSPAQELGLEQIWEIGAIDGPPETIWSRITDATIVDGRVFVADVELQNVRAFTVEGEYLGELGREGRGPGEFARPFTVAVTDDTLRVYDRPQDRWTVFDAHGQHVRTVRLEVPTEHNFFERIWKARHGWSLGQTGVIGRRWPHQSITDRYLIAWRSGEAPDTLASFHANPLWVDLAIFDSLRVSTTTDLGADGDAWLMGDSLLIVVDGTVSNVSLYGVTPDGFRKLRERPLPGTRRPFTERDRERVSEWYFGTVNPDARETGDIEAVVVHSEWWSAWTKVRGDDAENVWLRRGGPWHLDSDAGERWVRWSLEDDSLREIHLPPGVEALRFREGYMVGVRTGEFGVEYLQLYRIIG